MNVILEEVFRNRGYDSRFLEKLEQCPHGVPSDTDRLCRRLYEHKCNGDLVVLLTDFDMDGIMSGVIGYAGLSELGFSTALFRPDVSEGYGFSARTIDRLVAEFSDVKAILTADVGITCYEGVERALSYGIDIMVTDHHKPGDTPVAASVVVDPMRSDESSGYAYLCGSAVLYEVLRYYAAHYMDDVTYYLSQIDRLRVFAGFGTISDSMPVFCENRQYIQDALSICRLICDSHRPEILYSIPGCPVYRRAFLGLSVIFSLFASEKPAALPDIEYVWEDFIGFYVAPTFNSVKRMRGNMNTVYDVFFGTQPQNSMASLYVLNEKRKQTVEEELAKIDAAAQPWAPYVYITKADGGLRGLLAQKILSRTGEPVLVLGEDGNGYSGSGRCPAWFPFLDESRFHGEWRAAGHNPSFGFSTPDEYGIDRVVEFLKERIPVLKPETAVSEPEAVVSMFGDGVAEPSADVLTEYLDDLNTLHPFGPGFARPDLLLKVDLAEAECFFMGKKKEHVRLVLPDRVTVVLWSAGDVFRPLTEKVTPDKEDEFHKKVYYRYTGEDTMLSLRGDFSYNYFRGARTIQFVGTMV